MDMKNKRKMKVLEQFGELRTEVFELLKELGVKKLRSETFVLPETHSFDSLNLSSEELWYVSVDILQTIHIIREANKERIKK